MITEEEFYKEKIFNKVGINTLKQQYPQQVLQIDLWYGSNRYKEIQKRKSFLKAKLDQASEIEEVKIELSNDKIYELFLWWERQFKVCYYCKLPEAELERLHNQPGHINKRYPKRGKSLELDRKDPHLPYSDIDNLVLACYWCNNAKTDTFTSEEFMEVGKVFKEIWKKRLGMDL